MKIKEYLYFFRIKDWFYIIGIAGLGFFFKIESFNFLQFLSLIFLAILSLAQAYGFNHYFDFKLHQKVALPEKLKDNLRGGLYICIFITLLLIIYAFIYSRTIFVLILTGITISFLYSSSYIHLKAKPLWNIILNSSGFSILFSVGYLINKSFSVSCLYLAGYIWIGVVPFQIVHLMAHKAKEKYWPFSFSFSLRLFYLTQMIWIFYSVAIFGFKLNMPLGAVFTLFYCIVINLILKRLQKKLGTSSITFIRFRNWSKKLNIVFGILLLGVFIFG